VTIELFTSALSHHRAGNLAQAEQLYRQMLAVDPQHPDAWHLLGVVAHQLGRHDIALDFIGRAIGLRPQDAAFYGNLGVTLAAVGRHPEAEASYRQALQLEPNYVDAYNNLGECLRHQGRAAEAVAAYQQALRLAPDRSEFYSNLGNGFQQLDKLADAEAAYQQSLRLQPGYAQAHNNYGVTLQKQGRLDEALAAYYEALRLQPDYAEAHLNLGNALLEQEESAAAEASYLQALHFNSQMPEAHCNLGAVLAMQGRLDEAEASYHRALQLKPEYAEAYSNLGSALQKLERMSEADTSFQQALRLKPDYPDALNNYGAVLQKLGRLGEAVLLHQRAIELRPDHAETWCNLGTARLFQGHQIEAQQALERAIQLKPGYTDAINNLGVVFQRQARLDEAVACYRQVIELEPETLKAQSNLGNVLQRQGKLQESLEVLREAQSQHPDNPDLLSNWLMTLNYDPAITPEALAAEHLRYGQLHDRPANESLPHTNRPDPDRRLRVGYVSPDFRRHAAAHFIEPFLTHHNPDAVEVFLYGEVPAPDATTARFQSLVSAWRTTCGLSDAQLADLIRADQIDILVDLAGHTSRHRLQAFTRRPAPVQVTYLGYPHSTGLRSIGYRLADDVTDPPDEPPRYSEQLLRLTAGYCCYSPPPDAPEVNSLPAAAIGQITFGSLHGLSKLNASVLDVWCHILQAIPGSRLLMLRDTLRGPTREMFAREFAQRGVADQVELRCELPSGSHMSLYHEVDIALDPFPWSGHTTECEALWMGVPVVSLCDTRHAGRLVASILTSAGLPQFIAHNTVQYQQIAKDLASDIDQLSRYRATLREQTAASALCDGDRFTRSLEAAYRKIWRNWCETSNAIDS
jgi:protein O-GlcNAc transferase